MKESDLRTQCNSIFSESVGRSDEGSRGQSRTYCLSAGTLLYWLFKRLRWRQNVIGLPQSGQSSEAAKGARTELLGSNKGT